LTNTKSKKIKNIYNPSLQGFLLNVF